jgi:hypothetical protein
MNCPRCQHGSVQEGDAFLCTNCKATFLAEGTAAIGEAFLRARDAERSYQIARHPGPRAWLAVALFFVPGALVLNHLFTTGEGHSDWGLIVLALALVGLGVGLLLRLGKVSIEVNEAELIVIDGPLGRVRPMRLQRESIEGLWVQCWVDDDGPTGLYALMVDQGATRSRTLFSLTIGARPIVAIAEDLAARLSVPSDTRGSDLR